MSNLQDLTVDQLRKAVAIKEEIERLQSQLDALAGGEVPTPSYYVAPRHGTGRRTMSASAKARIAAAQRARWAKLKGHSGSASAPEPKKGKRKRRFDADTRAKLAAAARARWAKAKAAGKSSL